MAGACLVVEWEKAVTARPEVGKFRKCIVLTYQKVTSRL
jgi:hypothetical protein